MMPEKDYKLFTTIAALTQKQLLKTIRHYLQGKYKKIISTDDYIYTAGDIPILLVAHMDTVFPTPPTHIYYDPEQSVMWSPNGLGADDRAGVFAILKILQAGLRPCLLFSTDEELGCVGIDKFLADYPKCINKIRYVIQLDRRGSRDCVFYDCDNNAFKKYVEGFGFRTALGSFSDISVLCPEWGCAGVNLSVGYYDEHQYIETLHTNELYDTIDRVKRMLTVTDIPIFKYIGKKFYSPILSAAKKVQCFCCGAQLMDFEVIPVMYDKEGHTHDYCGACCMEHVDWCVNCGKPFENNGYVKLCYKCREKENDEEWPEEVMPN